MVVVVVEVLQGAVALLTGVVHRGAVAHPAVVVRVAEEGLHDNRY